MARPVATILAIVIAASPLPTAAAAKDRRPDTLPHASPVVSAPKLPLAFEEREPAGLYTARAGGSEVAIRPASVAIAGGVRFELTGAARTARLAGTDRLPGVANYLVGTDRTKWRTNVPTFGGVRAMAVWPGVDVAYRGDGGRVAWDFHLAPHADPRRVDVTVTGAKSLAIDADGSLVARTTAGEVRQDAPIVYQETPSGCTPVEGRFELRGQNRYGFAIGRYDAARPLVIDPTIVYSLSFGTGGETFATGVAVDTQGNSYIVGNTRATDFPIVGGFDNSLSGFNDAFVTKVNANGTAFVYSTYLGGTNVDGAAAVAVDSTGAVYVTGATSRDSTDDFPVTPGAFQTAYGGADDTGGDGFVAKIAPDGASLVYASYLGGRGADSGAGIAVTPTGEACVIGLTNSTNFPMANAAQPHIGGKADNFVIKLNAAGSAAVFSTYLGGSGDEGAYYDVLNGAIAVATDGDVYVTGSTASTNFPTTEGAFQTTGHSGTCSLERGPCSDAFVTKLTSAGEPAYSTYLGGSFDDGGAGIAVDATGAAYVTGSTRSADLPLQSAFQSTQGGSTFCGGAGDELCPDAFVTKVATGGGSLVYSSFLGGNDGEYAGGIAIDSAGYAYVTGDTYSSNFPSIDPIPGTGGGGEDVYVARVVPAGTSLDFASAFGGSGPDTGLAIAVDAAGSAAYLAVTSRSGDFPRAPGAGKARGSTANDAGGVKIGFAPRKNADVRILKMTLTVAQKADETPIAVFGIDIVNDGPEDAENVILNVATVCALFRERGTEFNLEYVDVPDPGDPVNFVMRAPRPLRPREEATVGFFTLVGPHTCIPDGVVSVAAVVSSSAADRDLTNNARTLSASVVNTNPGSKFVLWGSVLDLNGGPTDPQILALLAGSGAQALSALSVSDADPGADAMKRRGLTLTGYRVYTSTQPNVQLVPANLFATLPPTQHVADVSAMPDGPYYVVTAVYDDGSESPPSSEVGGTLPTLSSVKVSDKKIVATGSGFAVGEKVTIGGTGFASAAKLKKNNTKLVQKSPTDAGGTIGELLGMLETGTSILIVFSDPKGNGVGYVYTK